MMQVNGKGIFMNYSQVRPSSNIDYRRPQIDPIRYGQVDGSTGYGTLKYTVDMYSRMDMMENINRMSDLKSGDGSIYLEGIFEDNEFLY